MPFLTFKPSADIMGYTFLHFPTKAKWGYTPYSELTGIEKPGAVPATQARSTFPTPPSGKAKPTTAQKKKIIAHIRLDREEDDDGAFYVAYLVRMEQPTNFLTFGARNKKIALKMANDFAKKGNIIIGSIKIGEPPFES